MADGALIAIGTAYSCFGCVCVLILILIGLSCKSCAGDHAQEQTDIKTGAGDGICKLKAEPRTLISSRKQRWTQSEGKKSSVHYPECDYFNVHCVVSISIHDQTHAAVVQAGRMHKDDDRRAQSLCDNLLFGSWPNIDLGYDVGLNGDEKDVRCGGEPKWFSCPKDTHIATSLTGDAMEPLGVRCGDSDAGESFCAEELAESRCSFQPSAGAEFACVQLGSGKLMIGTVADQLKDSESSEFRAVVAAGIFIGLGIISGVAYLFGCWSFKILCIFTNLISEPNDSKARGHDGQVTPLGHPSE